MYIRVHSWFSGLEAFAAIDCPVEFGAKVVHFFGVERGIGGEGLIDLLKGDANGLLLRIGEVGTVRNRRQGSRGFGVVGRFEVRIDGSDGLFHFRLGGLK